MPCHTCDICMVCLLCGLSCECLDLQTDYMPCHTCDICMVSLHWILLWLTRCPACVNRLLQTLHSNGFSPEWICLCRVNTWLLMKLFPHSVHLYLLLWTYIWCLKLSSVEKHFWHWAHEYEITALCVASLCSSKPILFAKRLSHTVHTSGLSPLCSCLCVFKCPFCVNRLSHTVHTNGFSPLWIRLWTFKRPFVVNRLSHTVHKYGLVLSSCGCSVISLLSASGFTSTELSPVWYAYHEQNCKFSEWTIYATKFQHWLVHLYTKLHCVNMSG